MATVHAEDDVGKAGLDEQGRLDWVGRIVARASGVLKENLFTYAPYNEKTCTP